MIMWLFSKDDKNLWDVIWKNKIATTLFTTWLIKFFKQDNPDPRTLEVLADFLLLTDSKDIGDFGHLHHWITGYVLKSLSQARQLPEHERKAKILRDLGNLSNPRKRMNFIRSTETHGRESPSKRFQY